MIRIERRVLTTVNKPSLRGFGATASRALENQGQKKPRVSGVSFLRASSAPGRSLQAAANERLRERNGSGSEPESSPGAAKRGRCPTVPAPTARDWSCLIRDPDFLAIGRGAMQKHFKRRRGDENQPLACCFNTTCRASIQQFTTPASVPNATRCTESAKTVGQLPQCGPRESSTSS